jgi:hypothetical protein
VRIRSLVLGLGVAVAAAAPPAWAGGCPGTPGNAHAFLSLDGAPANRCPAEPIVRWTDPQVVFECGFFLDPDKQIDCGGSAQSCVDLCNAAAADWNDDIAGHFDLVPAGPGTPVNFCDDEDGRTSVSGGTQDCQGAAFGSNVLAVALRLSFVSGPNAGKMLDSDITVNQAFSFAPGRFRATVAHEFGHVIGLDHPNQCPVAQDFNVLMRSASQFSSADPCFVLGPTGDDVSGALRIYPASNAECGDADGDGQITDVDAVQVLRHAASLSSVCSLAICDVNGDGDVSDVDGVNVLRAAASLPANISCN